MPYFEIFDRIKSFLLSVEPYSFVISPIILVLGLTFAYRKLSTAIKTYKHNQDMHMYTQTMLHNREICSDQYKKMAVEVFHDLSGDQNAKLRSSIAKTQEGYFELYWAARAIHISHLNLIYQSWIIAGGTKEKYEKRYPGWANFAGLVALDLRTSEPSLQKKPFWYQKACEEIDFEFKDGSMYSKSFHEYMEMCRYEALQKRHQEEANKQTQVTLSPPTQQPQ